MMVKNDYDDATMKMLGVAEGHGRDRRLRQEDRRADAAVHRHRAGLRGHEAGHAEHDTAAVCAVLEAMAGVKRRRKARPRGAKRS